jgi:hypothetical protein
VFSDAAAGENLLVYPHVTIRNDSIEAVVFVPDPQKGFYRSTRFEWSGMVRQVTFRDHTYFVDRNVPHDPLKNGNGMSLAEEFCIGTSQRIPQRYQEAKPGETFMKIGVGNLEKPDGDSRYQFSTAYINTDPGVWAWDSGPNWVSFTHKLADKHGFAYTYTKRMELVPGSSILVISHRLSNTGKNPLSADQYNHNFFTIDNLPIGPGYEVRLFFPGVTKSTWEPVATLADNHITIKQLVKQALFGVFSGFGGDVAENHVIIRNMNAGAGVDISGDFPLSGFNFYSSDLTICPELFVLLEIQPGETKSWTRTYRFFTE